jgi:NTP pyrophosphatase (non-canonical NTP hydrolase)
MPMHEQGRAKLAEEMGEVQQILGKLQAYPQLALPTQELHPDGTNLRHRLENELGDLIAAVGFTIKKMGLNEKFIEFRANEKSILFNQWDKE